MPFRTSLVLFSSPHLTLIDLNPELSLNHFELLHVPCSEDFLFYIQEGLNVPSDPGLIVGERGHRQRRNNIFHTELDISCDAVCEPLDVLTVWLRQHFPICGLKTVPQHLTCLQWPSPDRSGDRRVLLNKGLVLWQKRTQVVIRHAKW